MINVRIIGPTDDRDVLGRVDTGADDTLIPDRFAAAIGVVNLSAPVSISGIGGGVVARFGSVDLEISDGQHSDRWSARVGFLIPPAPPATLYGIKGFLQFFRATFNGRRRYLDLIAQGNPPPPQFGGP
ncbi:MAG: aspartyl protease family protein [Isosphaeraceae bacterium]|nr:aspartyl protease family protein [Isosphaeraceae bacterium]